MPLSTLQLILDTIEASSRQRRVIHTAVILLLPESAPAARALDRRAVLNIVVTPWKLTLYCSRFHSDRCRRREWRGSVVFDCDGVLRSLPSFLRIAKASRLGVTCMAFGPDSTGLIPSCFSHHLQLCVAIAFCSATSLKSKHQVTFRGNSHSKSHPGN